MEVHVGKHHSDQFECGLCEHEGKTLDKLKTHLVTCEMFTCTHIMCNLNFRTISNLKCHINEKHNTPHLKKNTEIIHSKIDRNNLEMISTSIHQAINFFEFTSWKEIQ